MNTYETTATVEAHGEVRVVGVPFAPGTEVEVMIRENVSADAGRPPANLEEARLRMKELFARVRVRNTPATPEAGADDTKDSLAEIRPFVVHVHDVDDSRDAIYTRMDGE